MPNADLTVPKQQTHLFQKGQSGNPKGRPPGARNKTTRLCQELLDASSPELIKKAIAMALEGSEACLRMCIDRILPIRRDGQEIMGVEANADADSLGIRVVFVKPKHYGDE